MSGTLFCSQLIVKKSPIHGYGVFANQDIQRGAIIEECHTLLLKKEVDLNNYSFETDQCGISMLPLGYGAIYNHSDQPNASYAYDAERGVLIFYAKQPIKKGEEIFSSYGAAWFSSRRIKPKITLRMKIRRAFAPFMFLIRFTIVTVFLFGLVVWLPKLT